MAKPRDVKHNDRIRYKGVDGKAHVAIDETSPILEYTVSITISKEDYELQFGKTLPDYVTQAVVPIHHGQLLVASPFEHINDPSLEILEAQVDE